MTKLFIKKPVLCFLWLLTTIYCSCPAEAYASAEQQSTSQSDVNPAAKDSTIVARIAYYTITKDELEKRLMTELYPYDYDYYNENAEPVDAKSMLTEMVAEKAMIIEARAQSYLDNEAIHDSVSRFKERKLVNLLLQKHIEGKVNVTEDEIKQKIQANPKLDEARAKTMVEREKINVLLDQYYKQIYLKSGVKKLNQNFPRVVQIHERLLHRPKQSRKASWIQTSQVREELTPEEKNIVLAQYSAGRITLKDWFETLCDIVPPRRPRNLNTPDGVDQLLERAMRIPLLVSEAKMLRLDKDQDLIEQVRDYEDRRLLGEIKSAKRKELKEPTTEQIIAYFAKNKEAFGTDNRLKIDQIWCQDTKTAKQARTALDSGEDFEAVRKQYSIPSSSQGRIRKPSWLLLEKDVEGKAIDRVSIKDKFTLSDFSMTSPPGATLTVGFLGTSKIVYWEGTGRITKFSTGEGVSLPLPQTLDYSIETTPGSEGIFWKDLWAGDPNSIIGPIKGFYRQGIKWRIVKILQKTPGKEKPYSSNMAQQVNSRMMSEQYEALIDQYSKELLDKYPYQIYEERIKGIDPLDIP